MAASLTRPIGNRAIHLRITPRPSSLGESREIMRLLSQFGEIEYFKSFKYDALALPNAALVIYKDDQAAHDCLRKSPIRFRMGKAPVRKPTTQSDAPTPTSSLRFETRSGPPLPLPPRNPIRMPFEPIVPAEPPSVDEDGDVFQIITSRSTRNFRDHVDAGHYHGGFGVDSKMPGQHDLVSKVPFPGLSCVDWKAKDRPWRLIEAEKKRMGGKGSLRKLTGQTHQVDSPQEVEVEAANVTENTSATGVYKPFGDVAARNDQDEARLSANDTLDSIMKGWGSVLPGGSSPSSDKERYSGRRKWE